MATNICSDCGNVFNTKAAENGCPLCLLGDTVDQNTDRLNSLQDDIDELLTRIPRDQADD